MGDKIRNGYFAVSGGRMWAKWLHTSCPLEGPHRCARALHTGHPAHHTLCTLPIVPSAHGARYTPCNFHPTSCALCTLRTAKSAHYTLLLMHCALRTLHGNQSAGCVVKLSTKVLF